MNGGEIKMRTPRQIVHVSLCACVRARGRTLIVGVRHFGGLRFCCKLCCMNWGEQLVLFICYCGLCARIRTSVLVSIFKLEFRSVFIWDERKHHEVASIGFLCGFHRRSTPPPPLHSYVHDMHCTGSWCIECICWLAFTFACFCHFLWYFSVASISHFLSLLPLLWPPDCQTHSFAYL